MSQVQWEMVSMSVLVTGAAGFIGYHVTRALLDGGETVFGIDNLNSYYAPALKLARLAELAGMPGFSFAKVDFADPEALAIAVDRTPVSRIVHLGAQAGVRHSLEAPLAYVSANLAGHVNILELARTRGCSHLVYASSSSVYGTNRKLPFSVDDRTDSPASLYAATKRADELLSESYAHLFRLPQTGLRFFTVYGPWGRPDMVLWRFTEALLSGRPLQLYNYGEMQRDFTYIDDIVRGVLAALDRPPADDSSIHPGGSVAPHAVYNLGNDQPVALRTMLALVEAACSRTASVELLPMQPGDVVATWADITASRRDLDFAPSISLAEGVSRFVDWYRAYTGT